MPLRPVFIHPLLPNSRIEFDPDLPNHEKLRLLCQPEALTHWARGAMEALFPERIAAKPFRPDTTSYHPEVRLTEEQKLIRRTMLTQLGYDMSEDRNPSHPKHDEDVPHLGVFFDQKTENSITHHLNKLPRVQDAAQVGQTEFRPPHTLKPGEHKLTRNEHTKVMGLRAMQSLYRDALMTPDEFTEVTRRDITDLTGNSPELYRDVVAEFFPEFDLETILHNQFETLSPQEKRLWTISATVLRWSPGIPRDELRDITVALYAAQQSAQYYLSYIYNHDAFTPAYGDIPMKTFPESENQASDPYSEDAYLSVNIRRFAEDPGDEIYDFLHNKAHLNSELFIRMTESIASEKSHLYGAKLFKAKYKFRLPEEKARHPLLSYGSAYCEDQEEGTDPNARELTKRLPGDEGSFSNQFQPIGSFDDRARLLMYAALSGMTSDQIQGACNQLGIERRLVFIKPEEYKIWHKMKLTRVPLPDNPDHYDILPVCVDAGAVKRALTMFNILQIVEYRGPMRDTIEAMAKHIIAAATYDQKNHHVPGISLKTFRDRSDNNARNVLKDQAPLFPYVLEVLRRYATRWSQEDFARHLGLHGNLSDVLAFPADLNGIIQDKGGTMIRTITGNALPASQVLDKRLIVADGGQKAEPDPDSLFARFAAFTTYMQNTPAWRVFVLPKDAQTALTQEIAKWSAGWELDQETGTRHPATNINACLRTLGLWNGKIRIGNKDFSFGVPGTSTDPVAWDLVR